MICQTGGDFEMRMPGAFAMRISGDISANTHLYPNVTSRPVTNFRETKDPGTAPFAEGLG